MIWHALKVAPLQEQRLARELRRGLGLETYVPVERVQIVRLGRRFERRRALLPGWLFVGAMEAMPWRDLAETRYVRGWATEAGSDGWTPARLTPSEIARMQAMEAEHNRVVNADPQQLRPGDRARVRVGPWRDVASLITAVRGSKATIEVHMLNSTRLVTVSLDALEPAA